MQEVSLYLFRLESNSYSKFNLHGDCWLQNCLLYNVYKLKCSNDHSRLGTISLQWANSLIPNSIWNIARVSISSYLPATVPQFPCELSPCCSFLSSSWTPGTGNLPSALSTKNTSSVKTPWTAAICFLISLYGLWIICRKVCNQNVQEIVPPSWGSNLRDLWKCLGCLTFYPESQKMLVQQSLSTDSDMAEILTNEYYRVLQSWYTELLVLPQVIHLKDFSFGALQTVQAPSLHKP